MRQGEGATCRCTVAAGWMSGNTTTALSWRRGERVGGRVGGAVAGDGWAAARDCVPQEGFCMRGSEGTAADALPGKERGREVALSPTVLAPGAARHQLGDIFKLPTVTHLIYQSLLLSRGDAAEDAGLGCARR